MNHVYLFSHELIISKNLRFPPRLYLIFLNSEYLKMDYKLKTLLKVLNFYMNHVYLFSEELKLYQKI
jgi:hypothetical protein